jgi:hypothetical protein
MIISSFFSNPGSRLHGISPLVASVPSNHGAMMGDAVSMPPHWRLDGRPHAFCKATAPEVAI